MEQLVIMDYIKQEIHLFDINTDRDIELSELGFKDSDCHYMFGEYIPVIVHEGVIR